MATAIDLRSIAAEDEPMTDTASGRAGRTEIKARQWSGRRATAWRCLLLNVPASPLLPARDLSYELQLKFETNRASGDTLRLELRHTDSLELGVDHADEIEMEIPVDQLQSFRSFVNEAVDAALREIEHGRPSAPALDVVRD